MIVKVQQSIAGNAGKTILIYNKERKYQYQSNDLYEVDAVSSLLDGRPKAYFNAKFVNTKIQIHEEVEEQSW